MNYDNIPPQGNNLSILTATRKHNTETTNRWTGPKNVDFDTKYNFIDFYHNEGIMLFLDELGL